MDSKSRGPSQLFLKQPGKGDLTSVTLPRYRLTIAVTADNSHDELKEILHFVKKIEECLQDFSTTEERTFQPAAGIVNRPNGQKTLFRPFTSPSGVGTKIIVDPAPNSKGEKSALHGTLVLCDHNGLLSGIINAEEVTGYRTSVSAIIPFTQRRHARTIVIFGAGKQALWHARLALALRGEDIRDITIVNRTERRAQEVVEQLQKENNEHGWKSNAKVRLLSQANATYQESLSKLLSQADVIFCTVPSQTPLFAAKLLLQNRGESAAQPLVTAIGSWQPDMIELDPELLQHVKNDKQAFNHTGGVGGIVVVDDREGALQHAGEIIQSKTDSAHLAELGELLALQRDQVMSSNQSRDLELDRWLAEGLVLYKSIGVSVTDLVAGEVILSLAKQRGAGVQISDI